MYIYILSAQKATIHYNTMKQMFFFYKIKKYLLRKNYPIIIPPKNYPASYDYPI